METPKFSNYNVVTASAGSGKTYTLVQRILVICLKYPDSYNSISHILALTFTNKAANEMKDRLIAWLKKFTSPEYKSSSELEGIAEMLASEGIKLEKEELKKRSQNLLNHVLHNYSSLSIGTIDKFNSKLIRSFSYEMGLAHQFSIEINDVPHLTKAVDLVLDQIGENPELSVPILKYIEDNLEEDSRPNIKKTLFKAAQEYNKDTNAEELKKNNGITWEIYENLNREMRAQQRSVKKKMEELVSESIRLIQERGLTQEDFNYKSTGIGSYFIKAQENLKNGTELKLPGNPEGEAGRIAKYEKGPASDSKKPTEVFEIVGTLIENRNRIIEYIVQKTRIESVLPALLALKVNTEIKQQLEQIEKDGDLVLLSKFNLMIEEHLRNEPSQFIYEKIGTRYNHYFLDEFQDTSRIQWNNLKPLLEDATQSQGKSFTLVGDPKQSIYRFRGGDSTLMLEVLDPSSSSRPQPTPIQLSKNYRSAKNIVNFNNELYEELSKDLNPQHRQLFSQGATQTPMKDFSGRVKFQLSSSTNLTDYKLDLISFLHQDIQECLNRGYKFSDLTLLCQQNKQIAALSNALGQLEVQYGGTLSPIKTISDKGLQLKEAHTLKALICLLTYHQNPAQKRYLVEMLYYLSELGKVDLSDYTVAMEELLSTTEQDELSYLESQYNLKLKTPELGSLNLYNYIEYYLNELSVKGKETGYVLTFLDEVYKFAQNQYFGISDFLEYWENEAKDIAVQGSHGTDAIKIMTIHSAKGLEFPVVFLPLFDPKKEFTGWYALEDFGELKSVHLKNFNKDVAPYDSTFTEFNSVHQYEKEIDELCNLYVATTRASEQLFMYVQKSASSAVHGKLVQYFESKSSSDEFDLYPVSEQDLLKQEQESEKPENEFTLDSLESGELISGQIKIATPSKSYQTRNEAVRVGIFVHEILEQIVSIKDVDPVLERYALEGILTQDEKMKVQKRILEILQDSRFKDYFQEGLAIRSEKELLYMQEGQSKLLRVDRLIRTPEGWIILDFKTGSPSPEHQKQLDHYKEIMESLGHKVVKTELLYL